MKLYATTTSERASKGQGGNNHVLVVLTAEVDGERIEIASMSLVNTSNDYYVLQYSLPDGERKERKERKEIKVSKGNKQKTANTDKLIDWLKTEYSSR